MYTRIVFLHALWLLGFYGVASSSDDFPTGSCRCFPGEACWPSESEWTGLNKSVDGQVIATIPLGSVCHGETYNEEACTNLKAIWPNFETHIDTSSSILAPYFANQSCDPFLPKDTPCVIGTYVQYAVKVSEASDIQHTLAFAKEKNLRLVIKNTGHDYLGKSTGAGGLGVWTHHLKDFEILDYQGSAYSGKAVRIGAGLQAGEAAEQAFKEGLTLVGGVCPSVGPAGGFTQGGGLGPLTSRFGFGADQVLEWQVVLADGTFVTVTPKSHPELYWALSGGGGGSYGVVYSMTVKAHKNELVTAANLTFANSGPNFFEALKSFHGILPALSDAGGTSLWNVLPTGFSLVPATGPKLTKTKMDSILKPVIQKLDALDIPYNYTSTEFPSYYESFKAYNPELKNPGLQIGGRVVSRSAFTANSDGFVEAVKDILANGASLTGTSFKAPKNTGPANSVNPALRDSMVSFQINVLWNNTDWESNLQKQKLITDTLVPKLADLLPDGGSAYLNQADFNEPKWQQVFYGENYKALLEAKRKYDPDDLFWGRTAVGSERWEETREKKLCRTTT